VTVGSAQLGGVAGGAAVPLEAGGGSRWKPEVGADGSWRWEPMERRKWAD
jgi:hypothetical protein